MIAAAIFALALVQFFNGWALRELHRDIAEKYARRYPPRAQ